MRKPIVMGNWKSHGSVDLIQALLQPIVATVGEQTQLDIAVCPPSPYLTQVADVLGESLIGVGSQDVSAHNGGAYTGEVSAAMLADLGVEYALIGHSERRAYHGEINALCRQKFDQALAAGITPVICVGETLAEREAEQTFAVIQAQISAVFSDQDPAEANQAIVAYEPVWAIGTGLSASPEQAQAVHAFIRETLAAMSAKLANQVRIVYGGSVKPNNAQALFAQPDIDGGLIGGAALVADDFIAICGAAGQGF